MQLELDRYDPPTMTTVVDVEDLPRIWSDLDVNEPYGFTWNNGGEEGVLIVAVEEDHSTATLLHDSTFYDLAISDAQGWVETMVLGEMVRWPRRSVLPRKLALDVLMKCRDTQQLLLDYTWHPQEGSDED